MVKQKSYSLVGLIISGIAIVYGISMISDNYETRYRACDSLSDYTPTYTVCIMDALETHNANVNKGWGFAIVGGIVALATGWPLFKEDGSKKR